MILLLIPSGTIQNKSCQDTMSELFSGQYEVTQGPADLLLKGQRNIEMPQATAGAAGTHQPGHPHWQRMAPCDTGMD